MTPRRGSTVGGYSYQWSLFADWCAAADVKALPASPITLAEFLAENPASEAVQLRRVSAINRAHLDAGQPAPGRVTSIRIAMNSIRSNRTIRRAAQYQTIAARLPTSGSTTALFGRRDAVLLVLAGAGLAHKAIAELDRTDITTDDDTVWIGGRHRIRIAPHDASNVEPATIWHRWHTVLQFSERYPSTTLLTEHLQRNTFPDMTGLPQRSGPVAVPIDRWGHLPLPVTAMTAAEVGAVITRHRTGASPLHTPRSLLVRPTDGGTDRSDPIAAPEPVSVELDSGYYRSGVEARRRAHTALADVPDMVDDVEDRIEQLLQRTLQLLDSSTSGDST
ncbi:hypothetical protein O4160_22315 [Rhodococcus sp. IEGM 1401]|uniref:hypothetical protein n=1 Tax=unclassified Rhodococcus (in: high G+C Gram-positive bacteria) TaxID=192944 RepID=UPI001FB551CA|nr:MULTISPECIES: hypothetical protein [unclassified Rhodococcus (in: high G+C Gram-positive bacteria)]MCJ0894799.1 hypothetical protein [Rhodococcus sp. ARC_M5]MCJ0980757.1 hypothetical protein [Rhodococcus sp. ARC_M12]MCZ4563578.1 hypothetical protein [Rhodococcus sp. IEGM 1401]MDI9923729.1 hypothetical protein [Rhodococcus sp. IEGM 1372]MDV8036193.1 hypothetical protein [Rhodococcus sp. IEGM 1414]